MAYESYKLWSSTKLRALLLVIVGILASRGIPVGPIIGHVPEAQYAAATQAAATLQARVVALEAMTQAATAPATAPKLVNLALTVTPATDGHLVTAVYKGSVTLANATPCYGGGTIEQLGDRMVWTLIPQADVADGAMIASTGALTFPAISGHGQSPIVADGWNGPAVAAYVTDAFACVFAQVNPAARVRLEMRDAGNSGATRTLRVYASDAIKAGTRIVVEWRVDDAEARDVYSAWGKAWPMRVTWPDARGIVADMMPGNGRTLKDIAAAVAKARQDNAQAVVYWNLYEPESGLKYLGQPSLLPQLREWATIADLRKIHTDAGVRVGVCIRPWKMTLVAGKLVRDEAADNVQALIDEARWAQANMGATVFYVDCAGDIGVRGADRLQAAVPGVLFLWEASGPGWSRYGWPMTECNAPGIRGETDRRCYPAARSALLHPDALSDADLVRLYNAGDRPIIEPWSGVKDRLKTLLGKEPW